MIIQVSPESSELVRAAADLILGAHIASGGIGLLSGAAALLAPKGGPLHRWSGITFVLCMLVMSGIGAIVAPILPQRSSVVPGLLTFYLVSTGWMSIKRQGPPIGLLNVIALTFALGAATLGATYGVMAEANPEGLLDGDDPATFYTFAAMAAAAAALDVKVMLGASLDRPQLLRRHLWRMGAALLIAVASFFLGQQRVLPQALRGSPMLAVPELLVVSLTAFWWWRLGVRKARAVG